MTVAGILVSFALVNVDHCGVSELLGELLLVPEGLKEQGCSNDGERSGGLRSVDRFKSIITPLGVMPVCKALNLVCFGIEPGVLQRAEFCLYLIVQVDEGSLFFAGQEGSLWWAQSMWCSSFSSARITGSFSSNQSWRFLVVGMRTLRAVVDCVPKGGPRFFNVIRGDGEVGELAVHG